MRKDKNKQDGGDTNWGGSEGMEVNQQACDLMIISAQQP